HAADVYLIIACVTKNYFTEINETILSKLFQYHPQTIGHILQRFQSRHQRIVGLIEHLFETFASKSLLTYVLVNLPFNVYLIAVILRGSDLLNNTLLLVIIYWVLLIQIGGTLLALLPLLQITKTIHSTGSYIYLAEAKRSEDGRVGKENRNEMTESESKQI